jgi:hypothetical protein
MACVLTSDYSLDCRGVGGIEYFYALDATGQEIDVTVAAGVVSAISVGATSITTLSGAMFKFEQVKQTAGLSESVNADEANGTVFYNSTFNAVMNKLDSDTLEQLRLLAANSKLLIIVKDNNGNLFMVGNDRGAVVTGGSSDTGTAMADRSGITIEFQGFHEAPMYKVTVAEA